MLEWDQAILHSRRQSNLWWISSNWKSPVLLLPDSEKNNSHQQEVETMSNVTTEERQGEDMFTSLKSEGYTKDSTCALVTINREFRNRSSHPCRIYHKSEINKDNLLCEWKAHETWQSTGAAGTRRLSVWCCIWLIWQNLLIRFTSTSA